jgi:hypothetical protein
MRVVSKIYSILFTTIENPQTVVNADFLYSAPLYNIEPEL